jgi:hypothetical protein
VTTPAYDKDITTLFVVDPYNDFISEGGKIWPRIKAVAEANNCVPNMLEVLNAARTAKLLNPIRKGSDLGTMLAAGWGRVECLRSSSTILLRSRPSAA